MKNFIRFFCLIICSLPSGGFAQNAPQSIAGTVVSLSNTATVPVYALDFINISSCDLKFSYDATVATATGVTIGPGMGGTISANLTVPGEVNFGWFTSGGINLPDSSVIFNIQFSKTGNGNSPVHWVDNGYSCEYYNSNFQSLNDIPTADYYNDGSLVFQSPDAPVTLAPQLSAVPGTAVSIPISVSGFQLIGSFSLSLQYDPAVLSFNSFVNDAGFPGMEVNADQPGGILASGIVPEGDTAISLADNTVFFTLNFDYAGGSTGLNWIDNGVSCQYAGSLPVFPLLNDSPQGAFYLNGMITESYLPAGAGVITGPALLCAGTPPVNYSVEEINYATGYVWDVPDGAQIVSGQNTSAIVVDFGSGLPTGNISVYGTNAYGNGIPSSLMVSVSDQPVAAGLVTGTWEVCQGQGGYLYSVEAIQYATTYNWLLPDGSVITSGINTNNIQVQYSENAANGNLLVYGTNHCGSGGTSAPRWIVVNIPPQILLEPVSPPAVPAGSGTAVFSLLASGTGLSYQWMEFTGLWNNLTESDIYMGVETDTLKIINPPIGMNANRYRCLLTGVCEPQEVTDGNATLTVLTPVGMEEHGNHQMVSACSNPFADFIFLTLDFPAKGNINIELLNLMGQPVISNTTYSGNSGMQTLRINTPGMKPGIYLLQLKLKTETNLVTTSLKLFCSHKSE